MSEILCSKSHEFVYEKNGFYYIGVTDVLLNKLGKIEVVQLPVIGEEYAKGEIFGFIEAENAASEMFMPITGRIEAVNDMLLNNPNKLNELSSYDIWLIKTSSEYFNEDKKDLICYNKYKDENL